MTVHGAYSTDEAKTYDADREVEPLWHIENAYIASMLNRIHASAILDVPVGTGRFFDLYASGPVTGVDLSPAMLEQAGSRIRLAKASITLVEASVTALPVPARHFDLVICWRLLHLLPPDMLDAVFTELRRVCRGTLCVQCYVPDVWWRRHLAKASRRLRRLRLIFARNRTLTSWSHIHIWLHPFELIAASARRSGWGDPIRNEQLGIYEGTRVLAVEWKAH